MASGIKLEERTPEKATEKIDKAAAWASFIRSKICA